MSMSGFLLYGVVLIGLADIGVSILLFYTTRKKFDLLLDKRGITLPFNWNFILPDSFGRVTNYAVLVLLGQPIIRSQKKLLKGFNFNKHASRFDLTFSGIHLLLILVILVLGVLTIIFR